MRNFIIIVCFFFTTCSFGQHSIEFIPVYGFQSFTTDKYYPINQTDSVKIETLKFYISSVEFIKRDVVVFREEKSFHLIDLAKPQSLQISDLPNDIDFTHIGFNVGVDSVTNVSGALDGDLDPSLGMYWTWQSGYINVKIEGKSNLCRTRLNEFSLHLGGYRTPNLSVQNIELAVKNTQNMKIYFDLHSFLTSVGLQDQNQIMSPGIAAVRLSEKFAQSFNSREK